MKKISFFVLLSTFALLSCDKGAGLPDEPIAVESVIIDEPTRSIALLVADSRTLIASVLPENATNKEVAWESADESIAQVSASGEVTGVKAGTTVVRARAKADESVMDECEVVVTDASVDVTGITLDVQELALEIDQSKPIGVTLTPANATNRGVQWSSSDPTVATVSKTGNVTGLKEGSVTITVTSDDKSELSASCQVVVTKKSIPATDMWMKTTRLELRVAQTKALDAVTIPTNATVQTMVWSSDDESVATVSASGEVTGVKAGTTTVWVKWSADHSIKDKCSVTVLASTAYAVGDLYPNTTSPVGVVFWKDPANIAKGKVVSLAETSTEWSEEKVQRFTTDENDGMKNMNTIRAIEGWEELYPAFKWCADKGADWYLPALSEMKTIYDVREVVNAAIAEAGVLGTVPLDESKDYWTSTERKASPQYSGVTIQFYKGFGGGGPPAGGVSFGSKDGKNNTRAIMSF